MTTSTESRIGSRKPKVTSLPIVDGRGVRRPAEARMEPSLTGRSVSVLHDGEGREIAVSKSDADLFDYLDKSGITLDPTWVLSEEAVEREECHRPTI